MVMFFSAGLMLLSQAPRAVLEAQERFVLANVIRGPSAAAIFLAPLVAFRVADATLTSAAIGVFLTRAVSAVCYFWACGARRAEPAAQPGTPELNAVDRDRRRAFLHKAGWLGLGNVLSMLVAYMDRFLIGAIGSATMVGQYVIAQEVVTKMWIASGAVISAGTPRMAAQRSEISSIALQKTVRQLTGMMWLGGALPAVVLIVWGGPILKLWLGKNFDPASVAPLQIMAVGLAVNTLSQINFSLLQIHGGEQRAAYLQVLNVLFVAVAVLVLVPVFGINGAALAFTGRLMLDAFLVRRLLDTADESCRKIGVSNIALAGCSAIFLGLLFAF
jgi:O-antigen/teichoic acid export membrane protein